MIAWLWFMTYWHLVHNIQLNILYTGHWKWTVHFQELASSYLTVYYTQFWLSVNSLRCTVWPKVNMTSFHNPTICSLGLKLIFKRLNLNIKQFNAGSGDGGNDGGQNNCYEPLFDARGNKNISATICIGRDIGCFLYAEFLKQGCSASDTNLPPSCLIGLSKLLKLPY